MRTNFRPMVVIVLLQVGAGCDTTKDEGGDEAGTSTSTSGTDGTNETGTETGTDPEVTQEYCRTFDSEEPCNGAVASTAAIQCRWYYTVGLIDRDPGEGLTCETGLDPDISQCHAVSYEPSLCDLESPYESCDPGSGSGNYFWHPDDSSGWISKVATSCAYRPLGWHRCWEMPEAEPQACQCPCL